MSAMEELETLLQSLQALKPPGVTKTKIESITALCIQKPKNDLEMQTVGTLWNRRNDVELRLLGYAAQDFEFLRYFPGLERRRQRRHQARRDPDQECRRRARRHGTART